MLSMLAVLMMMAEPNALYVATYIDVQLNSTNEGAALLKQYREATHAEKGNSGIDVVQEVGRPYHLVIIELWKDQAAFDAHEKGPATTQFRSKLKAIHNSPYDQRVHQGLAVDSRSWPAAPGAVSVVTHVDVPPPQKDQTESWLKRVAEESRKDEGNLRYDVFQQTAPRTNHFTVFEVWKDRKAFESHEMKAHTRQFREALAPMLGAPYDERLYTAQ